MTEDQVLNGRVAALLAAGTATVSDAREDAILAAILDGATIADARKQHGYHSLQRKEK